MISSDNKYWDKDSFLDVMYGNGVKIGRYTHTKWSRAEYKFQPAQYLPVGSTWKYTEYQVANWESSSTADMGWLSASSGSFPDFTSSRTRYYRKTLTFGDLTGYASFEVAVYARYGVAIYVNGEEIYRHNLPTTQLSSTTTPSSSDVSFAFRRAFASRYLLTSSTVIAIEVHYPSDYNEDDKFDAYVALVYGNTHRTWDGGVSGTHLHCYGGEYGENLWLNRISLKWFIESSANGNAYNTYTFNDGRADFINMYSIASGYYDDGRRPKSWKVLGSNDGTNWDVLDYQTNVQFNSHGHSKTFFMPQVRKGYKMYRWHMLQHNGADGAELAGVRMFAYDMPIADMTIGYEDDRVFYTGETVELQPKAKGFTSFSVSPALPGSLNINTDTGVITGTASVAGTTTHTVTATFGSQSYEGSLTLSVNNCLGDYRKVRVVFNNANSHNTPYYLIKKNGDIYHNIHFMDQWEGLDSTGYAKSQTDFFCVPKGTYELEFGNDWNSDWSAGTTLTLSGYNTEGEAIFIGTYSRMKNGKSIHFTVDSYWNGETAGWKYLSDGSIPDNWTSPSFDDSNWGAIPSSSTSSQKILLYRRKISFTTIEAEAYEIDMKCRAGVILYLNGVEVYRYNVEGALSSSTTSTSTSASRKSFIFVGLVGNQYLHTGENTFAVAVINPEGEYDVDFAATLSLRSAVAELAHSTGIESNGSSNTYDNLFNGNINNKWTSNLNEEAYFQYTWTTAQNRKQQVNKYCFTSAIDNPGSEGKQYTVSTTQDGTTWTVLATHTSVVFTERSQEVCFYISNPIAIRGMKVVVASPYVEDRTSVQLSIFDFHLKNLDTLTIPTLSYPTTNIEGILKAPIAPVGPSTPYYSNFSINPALPSGLSLSTNGVIYGTGLEYSAVRAYTITGVSIKGTTSSAVVFIQIGDCGDSTLGFVRITNTGSNGANMGYELIDLITNEVVGYYSGFANEDTTINHPYCFNNYNYRIVIHDNTGSAWPGTLQIRSPSSLLYEYTVSALSTPMTRDFFPAVFYDDSTEWSYLMDGTQAPTNWYTESFTSTWSTSDSLEMPNPTGATAYYCTHFDIYATSGYATFDTTVRTRGGYIVYVNGAEVGRARMPAGTVTSTTLPSTTSESPVNVVLSVLFTSTTLRNQNNLVCIEIHQNAVETVSGRAFQVSFEFRNPVDDGLTGGSFTYSHTGYYDSTWDERNFHAVDKNTNNKFTVTSPISANICVDEHMWVQFAFDNQGAGVFNYVKFYAGNSWYRMPLNIDVTASTNGETWVTLHHGTPNWTTSGFGTYVDYSFANTTPYPFYRVEVYGCGSSYDGLEIGEVFLGIHSSVEFCEGGDGYSGAFVNSKAFKPCEAGYSGYYYRVCKEDLTLDEATTNTCRLNAPKNLLYDSTNVFRIGFIILGILLIVWDSLLVISGNDKKLPAIKKAPTLPAHRHSPKTLVASSAPAHALAL